MDQDTRSTIFGFSIITAVWVGTIILLSVVGLYWGVHAYRYSAVENAKTDNAVFHASAQYNDGMVQRLEQLQESYLDAQQNKNQAGMDGIASITKHEFAAFPEERLNPDLQTFLHQMKIYRPSEAK